jgi:1-acyl-sn-glycerol-3-phosphate acyltransferase
MSTSVRQTRNPLSYAVLTAWARVAIRVFYRRAGVVAPHRVPTDRPAILAANHSNALGDIAVIVAKMPKFPRFLAAASWWKSRPARLLFTLGGVVPVYRRRDGATKHNASTFAACHDALATGAHVCIFPEGEMHLGTSLMPLKSGAARIALGAAAEAGVEGIVIVPVGLVYESRGRFRSAAAINCGEPIEVDPWLELYRADRHKAVRAVTDLLADRLGDAIAPADWRDDGDGSADVRRRLAAELMVLAPVAAFGAVVNAPVLLGTALASRGRTEGWQATAKGVAGTFLCPLVWAGEYALVARRGGRARALAFTIAAVLSGWAALGWNDRRHRWRAAQAAPVTAA